MRPRTVNAPLIAACLCFLHAGTPRVRAEGGDPPLGVMTLPVAEDLAVARDPRVKTARAALRLAQAERRVAVEWQDPELRLTYGETDIPGDLLTPRERRDEYEATARFYPPSPWTAGPKRRAGRARVRAAEADWRGAVRQVAMDVRRLFAEVAYLREDFRLVEELASVRDAARRTMEESRERGGATSVEWATAAAGCLESALERDDVGRQLERAEAALAEMIGVEDLQDVRIEFRVFPVVDSTAASPDVLCDVAKDRRQDLVALAWRLRGVEADLSAARRNRVPWLAHVQASYQERRGLEEDDGWAVQGAVPVPLFSLVTAGEDDVLAREVERMRIELEGIEEQVRRDVRAALADLQSAAEGVRRLKTESEPLLAELRSALTSSKENLELGLQARLEQRLVEAERAQLALRHAYGQACLAVEGILGVDLEDVFPPGQTGVP